MSAFLYDALTSTIGAVVAVGVFLISLAALDVFVWLLAGLMAALSPSFARAARVRSALTTTQEHQRQ